MTFPTLIIRGRFTDIVHITTFFLLSNVHVGTGIGVVLTAITNGKISILFLANLNHFFTVFGRESHWLFTENMLSGSGCSNGIFLVHGRRQYHINNIDVGIVLNLIKILVVITIFILYTVFLFPGFGFFRGSCYNSGQVAMLGKL